VEKIEGPMKIQAYSPPTTPAPLLVSLILYQRPRERLSVHYKRACARGLQGLGVPPQRQGIILSVKTIALFLLMFSPALGDIQTCRDAYSKASYATAIKECFPPAKAGSPEAQFTLGYMYNNGEGVPKDAVQAVSWWRKAADQGAKPPLGTPKPTPTT
jgi:TPR repeat protein